ncbi:MAG: ParB N-terminal domain-containing protein [Bacteroidales bacterium]|nr:ParB N-terminal domain-containing protein [Bacteroidales bacterium]
MNITERKISDIIPYENNPRNNKNAIEKVAESIREFGFKVPIIVDKGGIIVAGHTRLEAAKLLGLKKVPVIVADDLTPEQVKAFRLADNKVAEFSTWDFKKLNEELSELGSAFNFEGFEFSDFDFLPPEEQEFAEQNNDYENFENKTNVDSIDMESTFGVLVECENEFEQQKLYEKFQKESLKCKLLKL